MATPEQIAAGVPASANIVAQVPAPGGGTYYLGSDGGVFATGGAQFEGSLPGQHVNPQGGVVAIQPTASGKGYYVLGGNGAIYAYGDAQYQGGVNNLQGDSLAGQHQFGANALTYDPTTGGYRVVDTGNREYDFGGAKYLGGGAAVQAAVPQPNPLAQDPAFLAFLRTSGLGVDQAVQDYTRSVNAAQQARDTALREYDLTNPLSTASTDRQNLAQGYINRGFSGNGQQARAVTQFDVADANKAAGVNQDYTNAVNQAGQNEGAAIGKIATTGIEQGLDTGNNQGWNTFWQNEAQKYPGQSGTILKNIGSSSNNTSGSNGS